MISRLYGSRISVATVGVVALLATHSPCFAQSTLFKDGYYSDAVAGSGLPASEPKHGLLVVEGKVKADFSFDDYGCMGRGCDFETLVKANKYTQINNRKILRITPAGSRTVVTWYKGPNE
jgi:hypothetical protein